MLLCREGMKMNIALCDNEEKVDLVVDGVNKILDRVVSISRLDSILPYGV